jgi:hypothetical protein
MACAWRRSTEGDDSSADIVPVSRFGGHIPALPDRVASQLRHTLSLTRLGRPKKLPAGPRVISVHCLRTSCPPVTSKCDNFERNDIPSRPTPSVLSGSTAAGTMRPRDLADNDFIEHDRSEQRDAIRGICWHCKRWINAGPLASSLERITRVAPASTIIRRRAPLTVGST